MWQGYRNQLISNGSSPEEATIATNNDIISKVGTVSYTHLDVYKRQMYRYGT